MALCGGDDCRCRLTQEKIEADPELLERREGQKLCTTLGCNHPLGWHPTAAAGAFHFGCVSCTAFCVSFVQCFLDGVCLEVWWGTVTATVAAKDESEREHLLQALSPEHKRRVEALYEYAKRKIAGEKKLTKSWSICRFEWEEVEKAFVPDMRTPPLHLPISKFPGMDALMVDIELRCLKYRTSLPFKHEATVESFVEPVLLHIAGHHPDIVLERQSALEAKFFPADGRADFVLRSVDGEFFICVVEAKKDDMTGGRAQNYVEAEMILEMTKQKKVYGIVTNFSNWIFVEVGDSSVAEAEANIGFDARDGARFPRRDELQNVCDVIWSMCTDMMKKP